MRRLEARYGDRFFERRQAGVVRSARRVVPTVADLLAPRSVVDVGCGCGEWLAVWRERGVERIAGIDGSHVRRERLLIPADAFHAADLAAQLPALGRFDLAMCLEVAEHLPPACADGFVAGLVRLAPAVLFSAAVPYQGGTGHVNERWPSYWAQRFLEHDYVPLDVVRSLHWRDEAVTSWYRQNTLLYVQRRRVEAEPRLLAERADPERLDVVLPGFYEKRANPSTRKLWKMLRRRLLAAALGRAWS